LTVAVGEPEPAVQDEIRKRWMLMLAAATQEKFDGLPCRISGHIYDRDLIVYRGEPRVRDIKVTPKAASAMATRPSNGIREWGLDAAG